MTFLESSSSSPLFFLDLATFLAFLSTFFFFLEASSSSAAF
tara:strand:+ start:404 stop:526 length:123 start_codon:yes stop_codon:yes gene_type:complete